PVTFKVDMSLQADVTGVVLAGGFASAGYSNWLESGGITMTDADSDGIYEVTLNLPSGTYAFKFVKNGSSWVEVSGPCTSGNDRSLVVVGSDAVTYEACFSQCAETCVP